MGLAFESQRNHNEKPQIANKKLLRFSCFRIRKCPHRL
nr:MAG TPA: hypothetical protein [Caudoviricetes sp.]